MKVLFVDERVEGFFLERFNDRGELVGATQHDTMDEGDDASPGFVRTYGALDRISRSPQRPGEPAHKQKEVQMQANGVGFERDIRPLFRDKDVRSMSSAFDLSSDEDVRANADKILAAVADGSMPCDGPWPAERVELFRRWVDAGCPG